MLFVISPDNFLIILDTYRFRNFQVRLWNRSPEKAKSLVDKLNSSSGKREFVHCASGEECARGADVIITVTAATSPVLKLAWLKDGVHINGMYIIVITFKLDKI